MLLHKDTWKHYNFLNFFIFTYQFWHIMTVVFYQWITENAPN